MPALTHTLEFISGEHIFELGSLIWWSIQIRLHCLHKRKADVRSFIFATALGKISATLLPCIFHWHTVCGCSAPYVWSVKFKLTLLTLVYWACVRTSMFTYVCVCVCYEWSAEMPLKWEMSVADKRLQWKSFYSKISLVDKAKSFSLHGTTFYMEKCVPKKSSSQAEESFAVDSCA